MADKANQAIKQNAELVNNAAVAYDKWGKQVLDTNAAIDAMLKTTIDLNKQLKSTNTIKALNTAQKELEGNIRATALAEKEALKIQQEAEKLERQRIQTRQKQAQEAARLKREEDKLNSSYKKLSAELTKNRNKAKDLAVQYGLNSKQFKAAAADVNKLDKQLKKIDSSLGQNQRSVGNYANGLRNVSGQLFGALGVIGGVQLLAKALTSAFQISKKYEKQNAVLASILGKTTKETKALQEQSKDLGANTAFSATQVTELQTELAKLGKTEEEIIDSTEGIIDATLALGSETGETAALVGATLNAFQLGAKESGRVADVLTLSTQRSALSFEKLNTALPIAAGAAAAANVPFERMIAQLGQAADRGIEASTAATSLRNIYISLSEQGLTLDQALSKINTSQDKLTTATDLFGKRAAVTALALADTRDKTNELTEALENTGGTAKQVAETQLDTLDGQLKLLNSAWEGLILNINNSDTAIGSFSKSFVGFLTKALNQFANLGKEWELFKKSLIGGWKEADSALLEYIGTSARVEDSNGNIRQVKEVLDEVADSYKNLSFEQQQYVDVNEQLALALLKAGGEAEIVDGVVREYVKGLKLEKEELADLNYEYDDSAGLLEEQARNKQELNDISKETIRLADEEQQRLSRQVSTPDSLKAKGLLTAEDLEQDKVVRAEFTANAEESAMNLAQTTLDIKKREADKLKRIEEQITADKRAQEELRREIIHQVLDAAFMVSDQLFANAETRRQNELQAEIEAGQARLDNDELDAEQREEIQKQLAEKEKQLRKENAEAQKKDKLFQIGIETALGIARSVAESPLTFGLPFSAFVAAQGALQAALVASAPIPQFDKGSDSLPSGLKLVAEKRPEVLIDNGKAQLITEPTLLGDNYTGAKVIGGAETAAMYENITRADLSDNASKVENAMYAAALAKAFEKHSDRMISEMRNNRPKEESSINKIRMDYYKSKHRE